MPNWKKVITSGSSAQLREIITSGNITASGNISASGTVYARAGKFGPFSVDIDGVAGTINASGDISSSGTGSFSQLNIDGGIFTSQSLSNVGETQFDGDRRFLQTSSLATLFGADFNPGTTGTVSDFLNAVFYPNTIPEIIYNPQFTINEFEASSSLVGEITAVDDYDAVLTFNTQSGDDGFFTIETTQTTPPAKANIYLNVHSTASMNTNGGIHASGDSYPFNVSVADGQIVTDHTVPIRITPNTAPRFSSDAANAYPIAAHSALVNENTPGPPDDDPVDILTFYTTDAEGDLITVHTLSQSSDNHFSMVDTPCGTGCRRVVISTATSSYDFETTEQYFLEVSASDEHHGNTSGSYTNTLPITINVIDNVLPVLNTATQIFTVPEDSGSWEDNGFEASDNDELDIGQILVTDPEADPIFFISLNLVSGSDGGNTGQDDPKDDAFRCDINGNIKLRSSTYLNSDIFNQYEYSVTMQDGYNDAYTTGSILINITADIAPPIYQNHSGTWFTIESAVYPVGRIYGDIDGESFGSYARFTSDQDVDWEVNPNINNEIGSFTVVTSTGYVYHSFDISGSSYVSGEILSGSITASNAFGTTSQISFDVNILINNAPSQSWDNNTTNWTTNLARPTTGNGGLLTTVEYSDTDWGLPVGDDVFESGFTLTDPSEQLSSSFHTDEFRIYPINNLSASTYPITASLKDEHGFRTNVISQSITIDQSDIGSFIISSERNIIESALAGDPVVKTLDGWGGDSDATSSFTISYTPIGGGTDGDAALESFFMKSTNWITELVNIVTASLDGNTGYLEANVDVSGSIYHYDRGSSPGPMPYGFYIWWYDQYGNEGYDNSITYIKENYPPSQSFHDTTVNFTTNLARQDALLTTIKFEDTESNTVTADGFTLTDSSGQLSSSFHNTEFRVYPINNLSSSIYSITASLKDIHGFSTNVVSQSMEVTQSNTGSYSDDSPFYIIESALEGDKVTTGSAGWGGNAASFSITYPEGSDGSATLQSFEFTVSPYITASMGLETILPITSEWDTSELSATDVDDKMYTSQNITGADKGWTLSHTETGVTGDGTDSSNTGPNDGLLPNSISSMGEAQTDQERFIFTEGSGNGGKRFVVRTPKFNLNSSTGPKLHLYYYAYGSKIGPFTMYIGEDSDDITTADILTFDYSSNGTSLNNTSVTSIPDTNGIQEDQTSNWYKIECDLSSVINQSNDKYIYFKHIPDGTYQGDFSIDNVYITAEDGISGGELKVNQNISESVFHPAWINSRIGWTDNYGNTGSRNITTAVKENHPPTAVFYHYSTVHNTNDARGGGIMAKITMLDVESNTLDISSFTMTNFSEQLEYYNVDSDWYIRPAAGSYGLSGSTTYHLTASMYDEHAFSTKLYSSSFYVTQAETGELDSVDTYILESTQSGAPISTNALGYGGPPYSCSVTYDPDSTEKAIATGFSIWSPMIDGNMSTTPHSFITSSADGYLSLKIDLSGSAFHHGGFGYLSALSGSVTWHDQFDNVGSASLHTTITQNFPPDIDAAGVVYLTAEQAVSGSVILSASFNDAEGDDIDWDSFRFSLGGDPLAYERIGDEMIITANEDLPAQKPNNPHVAQIRISDEHAFSEDFRNFVIYVSPMIYLYKNNKTNTLNGGDLLTRGIFGDLSGAITSGSYIAHLMSGSIGAPVITDATYGFILTLVDSQSVNYLSYDSSGGGNVDNTTSTIRDFGNIDTSGGNYPGSGHSTVILFPNSSAVHQKPETMTNALGQSGTNYGEYTVYVDFEGEINSPVNSGVYYFNTATGVEVQGETEWGMIHENNGNQGTLQYYHLLPSSASTSWITDEA